MNTIIVFFKKRNGYNYYVLKNKEALKMNGLEGMFDDLNEGECQSSLGNVNLIEDYEPWQGVMDSPILLIEKIVAEKMMEIAIQ